MNKHPEIELICECRSVKMLTLDPMIGQYLRDYAFSEIRSKLSTLSFTSFPERSIDRLNQIGTCLQMFPS
jgi:hypothetical protein